MPVSLKSSASQNECVPWTMGQACPENLSARLVIVVPESYIVRLRLDVPTAILTRSEALLYAIEDKLPSIEGRGVLLLHAKPSSSPGQTAVELLVYPKQMIEKIVSSAKAENRRVVGVMAASEWWGIALPAETALWVDDGLDAWIKLPSGEVHSVNRCVPGSNGEEGLWIHARAEFIRGVVCYSADPALIESLILGDAWPDEVRWRVLPLAALYEAPRDHSEGWDLLTHKKWSALFVKNKGAFERLLIASVLALFLVGLGIMVFPMIRSEYVQAQQRAALKEAWKQAHRDADTPKNIEMAWNEAVGRLPLPPGKRIPHMDPLGVWVHINRLVTWLALPPLSNSRYEGQRWWLSWSSPLTHEQLMQFKQSLLASGWRVDVLDEQGRTQVVIASAWVE